MKGLQELKQYQKDLAQAIRTSNNGNYEGETPYNKFCKKYELKFIPGGMSYEFRHNHIAYCELRGRTRDQIEKPAENNLPNETYIEKIKQRWLEKNDEILRANS